MSQTWERFGFRETPYSTRPLAPSANDVALFTGRVKEGAKFLTMLDTRHGATVVLSGSPGVGKTSFFNAYQYWIHSEQAGDAPMIMPASKLTPVLKDDTVEKLAQRIVRTTVTNIHQNCKQFGKSIPPETKKIEKWLSPTGGASGLSFSLTVLGNGGGVGYDVSLPPVSEATFETWQEVLRALVAETTDTFSADGLFVCLDNAETVTVEELSAILMGFRDTFFEIAGVWWVIIGQSRLSDLLSSKDRRISERIRGGIEIPPMNQDELYELVERRIKVFRRDADAISPLSQEVHTRIFEASQGVARFALKTAEDLVGCFVSRIHASIHDEIVGKQVAPEVKDQIIMDALAAILFENQLKDELAFDMLSETSIERLLNGRLTVNEVELMQLMGTKWYFESEIAALARQVCLNGDLLSRKMIENGLMVELSGRNSTRYRLCNFAFLCASLGRLDELREKILAD